MKVLVVDKFPESGIKHLESLGVEVAYHSSAKNKELVSLLESTAADVLIVRSTKVTKEMLEKSQLNLVIRAGAGYNTIDVRTASELGIYVSNCPGRNSVAVAELAFGLMIALDRRIPDNVSSLKAGKWDKSGFGKARGLKGRIPGLVGLGNIGKEMIVRGKAFGMRIVAWSRSLSQTQADILGVHPVESPEEVAQAADVLSVHVALTPQTRNLIGKSVFDQLKPGSLFINTARSEVVDQEALVSAMREKGIRAGLDVFNNEPSFGSGEFHDALFEVPGVYGTHHIGASTDQAQEETSREAIRIVQVFKETGEVPNVVNMSQRSPASHLLVVRHRDRVGVLAHVFNALKKAGINVQETENLIFEGAQAAVARIFLDGDLAKDQLKDIRTGNSDILDLKILKAHGSFDTQEGRD